jgi:hypothetical protein
MTDATHKLDPTELFALRTQVEQSNHCRLADIAAPSFEYKALDTCRPDQKWQLEKLQKDCLAPGLLTLKAGAQVMLLKNLNESLVNGTLGTIVGFEEPRAAAEKGIGLASEERPGQSSALATTEKLPIVKFITWDRYIIISFFLCARTGRFNKSNHPRYEM